MGFKDWLTDNKKDIKENPFIQAMKMAVRDFGIQIHPIATDKEVTEAYNDAVQLYGSRVTKKFIEYKKRIGV